MSWWHHLFVALGLVGGRPRRAIGAVLVAAAVGVSGAAIYTSTTGGGGSPPAGNWAGTFDCYGSTPNCTETPPSCSETFSDTGAGALATEIGNVSAGTVICLTAGTYPAVTLSSVSKASDVIVRPSSGTVTISGAVTLGGTTSHIRFSGEGGTMNMKGATFSTTSTNDEIDHVVFTDCLTVNMTDTSTGLVLDHNRLQGLGKLQTPSLPICESNSEGSIQVEAGARTSETIALKITNSLFDGGCSDGIQVASRGVQVGPGNEVENKIGADCSPVHVDGIQCNGSSGLVVVGNYIHNNGEGDGAFMCGAGYASFHEYDIKVFNNVFVNNVYPWSIHAAGQVNDLIQHNVMPTTGAHQICMATANGNAPSGNSIKDNAFANSPGDPGIETTCEEGGTCSGCTADHNLNPGTSPAWVNGTGSSNGQTPVFVSDPASGYYHYELAAASPGYHASSDGTTSIGICSTCNGGYG